MGGIAARWVAAVAALGCCVGLAFPSNAGTDPARRWATLLTEHFAVHYYDEGEPLARLVATYAEEAREDLRRRIGWAPKERVHAVIVDEVDDSNGFATVLPYPTFTLWARPPGPEGELGRYDNWLRMLVFHEYAHVVHLDASGGLPAAFNAIFGRVWKPNTALPRWVTEGLAVWVESSRTRGGRLGSPLTEMHFRTLARAGRLPSLAELTVSPLEQPRGSSWYLFGGALFERIARDAGEVAIAAFVEAYGSHPLPFALQTLARRTTGRTLAAWYEDVLRDIEARAAAHDGVEPQGHVVLRSAREVLESPVFTPDGTHLLWVEATGFEGPRIVMSKAPKLGISGEPETIVRCEGGCGRLAVSRDGRRIFYSSTRSHRVSNSFLNLVEVPLEVGRDRRAPRVIGGRRAYDPAPSADGRSLWAARTEWGRASLVEVDVATGDTLDALALPSAETWLGRFDDVVATPDGESLFVSAHVGEARDLYRVDLGTRALMRLTHSESRESDLALSGDGRWLVYASDHDGTWNLYAMELGSGRHHQLTDVPTGAFQPALSPDGSTLVYQRWTVDGPSLAMIPFAPEAAPVVDMGDGMPPATTSETVATEGPLPYQALPTLLPRRWFPTWSVGNGGLAYLGWSSTMTDATGRYGLALGADWEADRGDWAGRASLTLRTGFPDLRLDLGRYTWDRESVVGDLAEPWREEVLYGGATLALPVPEVFASLSWGLSYTAELRRGVETGALLHAPDETMAFIPAEGYFGAASLFMSIADARQHPLDITPSEGFSLATQLVLRHPALGARSTSLTATAVGRAHLGLGVGHVLYARLGGGISGGDGDVARFAIGGVPRQDLLADLLNQTSAGAVWLRGFPENLLAGTRFGLLTGEWRFPLLRVREGLDTLPLALWDISAAVFVDAGGASDGNLLESLHVGLGGELRLGVDLIYGLFRGLRVGLARGLGPDGITHVYVLMGPSP
jgi:hypothetical protein